MAVRGSVKYLSVDHEERIAYLFNGQRSQSSGGAVNDPGDVRSETLLIECKMTRGTRAECPKAFLRTLEKAAQEAWEQGLDPMVALRYYEPQSVLADRDGYVDLTVRLASDDADREAAHRASV